MLCFLLYSKPCSSAVAREMVVLEHPLSGVKDSGKLCGPDVKVASTVASGDGARKHVWLDIDEVVNILVFSSGSGSVSISPGTSLLVIFVLSCISVVLI